MKNNILTGVGYLLMVSGLVIILTTLYSGSIENSKDIENKLQEALEKAYFEGQKDYSNDSIRIEKTINNEYRWINGGPWDNNRTTIWNP